MIQVKELNFAHVRPIFESVNFVIGENQKIGLVGPNGAGKSTLLKLLVRELIPQSGKIEINGSVGYVPQEVKHDTTIEKCSTLRNYLDPRHILEDSELRHILNQVSVERELYEKPTGLSGGQKTKLAIIRALIQEPDVLLLDEPTNFLDDKGKKWVMDFLRVYPKTLILISHDMGLLDNAIDKVFAVNPHTHTIEEYKGSYTQFLTLKKKHDARVQREITNTQKQITRMKKSLTKLYKHGSDKGVRQRVMLQRRIERITESLPSLPPDFKFKLNLKEPAWVGELPIRAISVSKSYEESEVLNDVNFSLLRGERIALIGPNGSGKSTFIKILMQKIQPDSGEVIYSEGTKIGYYSQEFETFDLNKTLYETVEEHAHQSEEFIRPFLSSFMFHGQTIFQNVGSLSGGEKTRLSIALLLLADYNVLILDEPTTYLDVMSQRIILEALKAFKGAMLVVSHTEDFIRELKPNRALMFPENKLHYWTDDLLERVSEI